MLSLQYIMLLFSAYSLTYGEDKCRSIPRMENFDAKKTAGFWYGYAMGDAVKAQRRCLTYNLTDEKGPSPNSVISYESWKVGKETKTVRIIVSLLPNSTIYRVRPQGYKETYASPIAADYNKYVTWYVCEPEHDQEGVIFILTKEKQLDNANLKKAENSLIKAGFLTSSEHLTQIDQTGC